MSVPNNSDYYMFITSMLMMLNIIITWLKSLGIFYSQGVWLMSFSVYLLWMLILIFPTSVLQTLNVDLYKYL